MIKTEEKPKRYICEKCCFKTNDKKDFNKHLLTLKHKMESLETNKEIIKTDNYICICGIEYLTRAGLWKHKKKCDLVLTSSNKYIYNSTHDDFITNLLHEKEELVENKKKDEMIIKLLTEKEELLQQLVEKSTIINNNTQNNIQNNNQFNLQFYLNETCSNAINIDTLLKNINVTIENVIEIGEIGYSKGISNLIAKHIKGMNQLEKPIQTTDVKRGLSWIKNKNNEWIKDEDLTLANNFIFLVGDKYFREYANGITTIKEWKDTQSKIHDKVVESISQITKVIISDDKSKDYSRIHKTIAESTMVKK